MDSCSSDYYSVLNDMKLSTGSTWTIPITLDVDDETYNNAKNSKILNLFLKKKRLDILKFAIVSK